MSWSRYNNAAGGTAGVTPAAGVQTNNTYTGGASGYYFDSITLPANMVFATDNLPPGATVAYKVSTTSQGCVPVWNCPANNLTRWYRGWFNFQTFGSSQFPIARWTGGTGYLDIEINPATKKVQAFASSATTGISTISIAFNTWYMYEMQAVFGTGISQCVVRLSDASGNLLETINSTANGTVLNPTQIQLCHSNNVTQTYYHGLHAVSTGGWIGTSTTLPLSLFNGCEGNANGTTITAANSGQLGADCFDAVGSATTADNSHPNSGLVGYHLNQTANSNNYFNWRLPGDSTQIGIKGTFYFAAQPSATGFNVIWINDTNGHDVALSMNTTTHKFQMQAYGGTLVAGSYVLTAGSTVDVHFTATGFSDTITATAVIVNTADGTVLDTITCTTGTLTTPTFMYIGQISSYALEFWLDDICASSSAWVTGGTPAGVPVTFSTSSTGSAGPAQNLGGFFEFL